MKNSKIHEGLSDSNLRDFLSMSIVKIHEKIFNNKKLNNNYNSNDGLQWSIADCENDIIFFTKKLESLKELQSVITLIKMQGWKEFDVSDVTENDINCTIRMNFIGSEIEYNEFINKLKN